MTGEGPGPSAKAWSLEPPRPNLGPEPWSEPGTGMLPIIAPILVVFTMVALTWWRRRSRKRRLGLGKSGDLAAPVPDLDPSPRARLIAAAESVRSALVAENGRSWNSRTTEEIVNDPALRDRLGPDRAARLVDFFRASDRAKFAGDEPDEVDRWETWAAHLLGEWAAGARSMSNGK